MLRPLWARVSAALLATALLVVPVSAEYAANQPFASYWFPNELLTWDPGTDPDAPYNRGTVPLATRFTNPATNVNSHARDGEAVISSLSIMYPSTSNNPSQGSEQFNVHAFSYWQYTELLVFWGGSAGEGLILAPNAGVIDSGHRNGVPVLGTIFFPPNVFGGQIQWVNDLLAKDGAIFPVADKLIEVADYYGFDGWFLNQETSGGDSTTATAMQEFLEYFQANKSPGQHMMWYDSMIHNGAIAWQNELNDNNAMFFEDSGRVSDSIFLNFGWPSGTKLADSNAKAQSLGRSQFEVFAGLDVQANGYNVNPAWSKIFPEALPHVASLGFFGTNWTYTDSSDPADYYARASRFWTGQNGDPSNTTTALSWKGMAHYVPARSPVDTVPWVTSFNPGQGDFYAVEGEVLRASPWNHRSLQDVLPTWRWIAKSAGIPLTPEISFADAYDGGACLRIFGDLAAGVPTDVDLFKTELALTASEAITIAYRAPGAGPSDLWVGLSFVGSEGMFTWFAVEATVDGDWHTQTISLAAHAGQTIAVISLRCESAGGEVGFERKIGRLGVISGAVDAPASATNSVLDDAIITPNFKEASLRIQWDASPDPIYEYLVYRRNPDLSRTFLGGTPNTALYIPTLVRAGAETTAVLEIEAVSAEFGRSLPESLDFFWGFDPPNEAPIASAGGPYCGLPIIPIEFDASASFDPDGTIVSWDWAFGDASGASGEQVAHAYAVTGSYEVIVTVTDDLGRSDSDTSSAFVTAVAPDPAPGLGWWPMNDGSGTTATDSTVHGNDASLTGPAWTVGRLEGALDFDGVDDWALVNDYPKSDTLMSCSAWVRADSAPKWATIAKNFASGTGSFRFGLFNLDGDLEVQIVESDTDKVSVREGVPFPLGEWHHVVFVADGQKVRLYRNAIAIAEGSYDGTIDTTRPSLGIGVKLNGAGTAPAGASPAWWDGIIDDLRIYDRAICPPEIQVLYDEGIVTAIPTVGVSPPTDFALASARPNPFAGVTELTYALPRASHVTLDVFDVTGRRVIRLLNEKQDAGQWTVRWRGRDRAGNAVASGVYFVRMEAGDFRAVKKVVRLD